MERRRVNVAPHVVTRGERRLPRQCRRWNWVADYSRGPPSVLWQSPQGETSARPLSRRGRGGGESVVGGGGGGAAESRGALAFMARMQQLTARFVCDDSRNILKVPRAQQMWYRVFIHGGRGGGACWRFEAATGAEGAKGASVSRQRRKGCKEQREERQCEQVCAVHHSNPADQQSCDGRVQTKLHGWDSRTRYEV